MTNKEEYTFALRLDLETIKRIRIKAAKEKRSVNAQILVAIGENTSDLTTDDFKTYKLLANGMGRNKKNKGAGR